MNIETERLILTHASKKHIEKIYEYFNEKVTKHMFLSATRDINET